MTDNEPKLNVLYATNKTDLNILIDINKGQGWECVDEIHPTDDIVGGGFRQVMTEKDEQLRISTLIKMLEKLPDMDVCQAIGPNAGAWGALDLTDEGGLLQFYVGPHPKKCDGTALIIHDGYVSNQGVWQPLRDYMDEGDE